MVTGDRHLSPVTNILAAGGVILLVDTGVVWLAYGARHTPAWQPFAMWCWQVVALAAGVGSECVCRSTICCAGGHDGCGDR